MDITRDDILAMTGDLLGSDPAPSVFVKMSDGRLRRMVDWKSLTTRRERRHEMNGPKVDEIVAWLICVAAIVIPIIVSFMKNTPVGCDYTADVVVDKSEKVEWAVSNAVANVESRRFALVGLDVEHDRLNSRWRVSAQGSTVRNS